MVFSVSVQVHENIWEGKRISQERCYLCHVFESDRREPERERKIQDSTEAAAALVRPRFRRRRKHGSSANFYFCARFFWRCLQVVFDECHRAKNLVPIGGQKPTKTGQAVLELQKALPNARVVYASATGATEPRNMAYMTRLGLWGEGKPFREFADFINAVERRGVGAMELVAMDMKVTRRSYFFSLFFEV